MASRLLKAAMHGLRDEAMSMDSREVRDQPIILGHLRLADRIERFLDRLPPEEK